MTAKNKKQKQKQNKKQKTNRRKKNQHGRESEAKTSLTERHCGHGKVLLTETGRNSIPYSSYGIVGDSASSLILTLVPTARTDGNRLGTETDVPTC